MSIKRKWSQETLPIVCPECSRTTHQSIEKLQQAKALVCPGCGKTTKCTDEFIAAIKPL